MHRDITCQICERITINPVEIMIGDERQYVCAGCVDQDGEAPIKALQGEALGEFYFG